MSGLILGTESGIVFGGRGRMRLGRALPNLPRFYQAMNEYRAGNRVVTVATATDSTGRGTRSGGGTAQYTTGWPVQLAQQLASAGYVTNWDNLLGTGGTAIPTAADSRVTATGGWAANTQTAGGLLFRGTSAGTLTFTPVGQFDTFEITYVQNGTGTATVNVDGGATLATINVAGAASLQKVTLTTTLGLHAINFVWASGTVFIQGIRCWNSAQTARIDVLNFGWASSEAVNNWSAGTNVWSPRNAINYYAPDLIILNLGLNDVDNGATTSAQYGTALQALIDAWKPTSDILACTFTPADITWESIARQDEWIGVARTVFRDNGLPLLDHYARRGSYAANPALYSDNVHGSLAGYADMASATRSALLI